MGVVINNIKFKKELSGDNIDFLLANVGDKIIIETTFTVSNFAISSTDNPFILNNTNGYLGANWVTSPVPDFENFKIGDTVQVYQYVTNIDLGIFTIIDKQGDDAIRLDGYPTGSADNDEVNQTVISVTTPIKGMKYHWNFIENNEQNTFASKVDGTIQLLAGKLIDANDVGVYPLEFIGATPYQIGSATIQGLGTNITPVFESVFKIIHRTYLTPFFLAPQLNDALNGIAPAYFFNLKTLKFIADISAAYNYNDPNFLTTAEISETFGNCGWFNENFNTGLTNYSIFSTVFKRPDTSIIPAIELVPTATSVEVIIKNATDSPFVNASTQFVLNFIKVPYSASEYQNNFSTLNQNFTFDRAKQSVGSGAVNGENYGGNLQVLKNIVGTFISASEIKITFDVEMQSDVITLINLAQQHRYLIWIAIQDHTLPMISADNVSLSISDLFYEDFTDDGLVNITTKMLRHPESDPTTHGVSNIQSAFPHDELTPYTLFYIDKTGRLADNISMQSLVLKMKIKNTTTLQEFDLEKFNLQLNNLQFINNNQYTDFTLNQIFHIPSTEIRKAIKVKRRLDLDTGEKRYYEIYYPNLIRWEYWEALIGAHGDFFDLLEPQNGWNKFWHRYTTVGDWSLFYEFILVMDKNSHSLTFKNERKIITKDYNSNPDWTLENTKSYDIDTNALLYDVVSMRNFILGYKQVRIESKLTHTTPLVDLTGIHVVMDIEVFEEGGVSGRRRISSLYPLGDDDSWWLSVDGSNKVKLTLIGGDTVKSEAILDYTKLPLSKRKFMITTRLYDLNETGGNKLFQDSESFNFQDDDNYDFQN